MLKIVHCADLHLTTADGRAAEADSFVTFCRIIDFANEQNAELMLIAGDLFDSVFVPLSLIQAVQKELARCNAEVYICGGNHDYCGIGSPLTADGYPQNVHLLAPGPMQKILLPAWKTVLYGCSFDAPHSSISPLSGFEAENDGLFHIGLLHADAMHAPSDYAPITLEQIDRANLDYLALGHVHTHEILPCASKTVASYPGTPQPRRFSEAGGGVNLVTVQSRTVTLTHHDLSARHYLTLTADMTGCDSDTEAAKRILHAANALDEPSHCRFEVTLTGETAYQPNLPVMEKLLESAFYRLTLKDETLSVPDLSDPAAGYSLSGIFLRRINQRIQDCTDPAERKKLLLARKYGLQAFYREVKIDAD